MLKFLTPFLLFSTLVIIFAKALEKTVYHPFKTNLYEKFHISILVAHGNGHGIILGFRRRSTPSRCGSYTVTIPANTIYLWVEVDSVEQGYVYDLPIVLHYTVSQSTGISDVKVEGNLGGVRINLNGQRIGNNYQGVVIENGVKRIMK